MEIASECGGVEQIDDAGDEAGDEAGVEAGVEAGEEAGVEVNEVNPAPTQTAVARADVANAPPAPLLSTDKLVKEYRHRRVVNGVSIYVDAGEIVGLLGPNGA